VPTALEYPSPSTAAATTLARRRTYDTSVLRGDYFVVHHLEVFLEWALRERVGPGLEVADVGCGEQPCRALITGLGGRYTGIDARQNSQGNVDVLADIANVPLPDGSFDVIVCTEVLEHVPNTQAAFAELARLCRTNGAIIITTPFSYPLHEEPYDFVRLTPHQLKECARSNDLEVAHLSTSGNELEVIATVWCNLWSRAGRRSSLRAAFNVLMRLPVNLSAYALTWLVGPLLPRKYFLSSLCVFVKRG
jgi:SAM-dependent methyltransferase